MQILKSGGYWAPAYDPDAFYFYNGFCWGNFQYTLLYNVNNAYNNWYGWTPSEY